MRWRPVESELVHMSLDPFLPRHAAAACDTSGPTSSGLRTPTRFQAFAGTEVLGPGAGEPVRPAHSDEVSIHERRRSYVHWYVAAGAEAVALALLIVVVGQQLTPVLGATAPDGIAESLAHDLGPGARELLARMSGAEVRAWLPSVLAALFTIMGPWLRRSAVRWGLGSLAGSRTVSVLTWLVVTVAGMWGLS